MGAVVELSDKLTKNQRLDALELEVERLASRVRELEAEGWRREKPPIWNVTIGEPESSTDERG